MAHQHKIDPERLIFVDETWIKTNMTRTHGWSRRGTRLVAKVPHGHWKTLTFIGGMRHDGVVAPPPAIPRCFASREPWQAPPCVFDGPINGDLFTAWVEQSLVPALKPRDIVVVDNLSGHKGKRAREAIKRAGAHLLFLPKYSPDLNPIELIFAKLKTLFRKADMRSVEAAWRKVGSLLDTFKAQEFANCFRHAGYATKIP
jgi:transposase